MKKSILFSIFFVIFLCVPGKSYGYTSPYSILTGVEASSNFSNTTNATNNDGTYATSSTTSYSLTTYLPVVSAFGLPSDAVLTGLRYKVYGVSAGGSIKLIAGFNGQKCITSPGDSGTTVTTGLISTGNLFWVNCTNGSFVAPTSSGDLSQLEIYITNASSGSVNPLQVDYTQLAVDYTSVSKDAGSGISDTAFKHQICGSNWLNFQDIFCNFQNWLGDAFNFFFGVDTVANSTAFNNMQNNLLGKAPFAYMASASASLDFTNTTTSSALPIFSFKTVAINCTVCSGARTTIPAQTVYYNDVDDTNGLKDFLQSIRPFENAVLYMLFALSFIFVIPRRLFEKGGGSTGDN